MSERQSEAKMGDNLLRQFRHSTLVRPKNEAIMGNWSNDGFSLGKFELFLRANSLKTQGISQN